jgi:hypothetical protein
VSAAYSWPDFPAGITAPGTYEYYVHVDSTEGAQVVSTGKVDWSGSASVAGAAGSMSGSDFRDYLVTSRGFKRDDKDSELYDAITDAIQIMRRRFGFDEAEVEAGASDTIDTLGQWQLDLESDLGLLLGIVVEDGHFGPAAHADHQGGVRPALPVQPRGQQRAQLPGGLLRLRGPDPARPDPEQDELPVPPDLLQARRGRHLVDGGRAFHEPLPRRPGGSRSWSACTFMLEEYDKSAACRQRFEAEFPMAVRRERLNSADTTFTMAPIDC